MLDSSALLTMAGTSGRPQARAGDGSHGTLFSGTYAAGNSQVYPSFHLLHTFKVETSVVALHKLSPFQARRNKGRNAEARHRTTNNKYSNVLVECICTSEYPFCKDSHRVLDSLT